MMDITLRMNLHRSGAANNLHNTRNKVEIQIIKPSFNNNKINVLIILFIIIIILYIIYIIIFILYIIIILFS